MTLWTFFRSKVKLILTPAKIQICLPIKTTGLTDFN